MPPLPIERLLSSVADWNEWRRQSSDEVDLEGADLTGQSFTGANLSGVNLKDAQLDRSRFEECEFDSTILYKASAIDTEFIRCRFKSVYGSQLKGSNARFFLCHLDDCRWLRADLEWARFDHSLIVRCQFTDANLSGASFTGALLADNALPGIEQARTPKPDTHLKFQWISDAGDDYALGQRRPGQPYAESLQRYARKERAVITQFAKLVSGVIRKHHRLKTSDVVVPVPPRRPEGDVFANAMLAADVARELSIKDGTNWLVRVRAAPRDESDIFASRDTLALTAAAVANKKVVLLDDLAVEGRLEACRQALQDAGAAQVLGLALARDL